MNFHKQMMQRALELARSAEGQTSPNPLVGAVCVKDGEIVGFGAHLKAGTPHAEVHALQMAGSRAAGSDLYVTLEPCSHHGKTPPCADLIVQKNVKRVFIATLDSNTLVQGRGVQRLRDAGIEVHVGLLEDEARTLNRAFFHYIKTKRPYVTLKTAITLDGRVATSTGDSQWITSEAARFNVHELRHRHDAILVGSGTVLDDNPSLTTRLPQGGTDPIRIILDRRGRTPIDATVYTDERVPTLLFTTQKNLPHASKQVEVISLDAREPFLVRVLEELGRRGIMTLFLEGGPNIHRSFIDEGLVDEAYIYIAPKLIGNGPTFFDDPSRLLMNEAEQLEIIDVTTFGPDIRIYAKFLKGDD